MSLAKEISVLPQNEAQRGTDLKTMSESPQLQSANKEISVLLQNEAQRGMDLKTLSARKSPEKETLQLQSANKAISEVTDMSHLNLPGGRSPYIFTFFDEQTRILRIKCT